MSIVETNERDQERRRRSAAYLILAAALVLILGLIGRSLLGDDDGSEDHDADAEVLSGAQEDGEDQVTGGPSGVTAGSPNQGNPGNSGSQGNAGSNPGGDPGGGPGNPGGGPPGGGPPGQTPGGTPAQPRTFSISGDVSEIYPTYDAGLLVTFSNPHRFEIVVTELSVEITPPQGPCATDLPDGVFTVGDVPDGGVPVPRRTGDTYGISSYELGFEVSNALPDACQNTAFGLTYAGAAIRANQQ